jgi:hypothetical protein
MPDRDNAELVGGQSVAHARKGTRIPGELCEAPNSHYLPGAGEGSSDFATPIHPSGDGSPGAPDGGGRGSGPPAHRSARHQQGTWGPPGARVLRLRPTSRPVRGQSGQPGRMVVSRRRAERRLRSLGRSARQLTTTISCSPKSIRPIAEVSHSSRNPSTILFRRQSVLEELALAGRRTSARRCRAAVNSGMTLTSPVRASLEGIASLPVAWARSLARGSTYEHGPSRNR